MSTARSLFLFTLCGLIGTSARPSSKHVSAALHADDVAMTRRAMPHGARIHRDAPCAVTDAALANPREELLRILREAPEEDLRALGAVEESLLALLPLERLRAARRERGELVLEFETGPSGVLEVEVPVRTVLALDAGDDEIDPTRRGRIVKTRGEPRVLLIHRVVRFQLGEHGIDGVRDGDLEVRAGPFDVDLDLRTERRSAPARDRYGRPLVALDEHGEPVREDGRWRIQHFERWLVLEALGHRVEIGW